MAPSTYAEDFLNSIPIERSAGYAIPEKAKSKAKRQVNKTVEVIQGTRSKVTALSKGNLARAVFALCLVGFMLIATVWMTAKASSIKYSVNQMIKQNAVLEDEITMLRVNVARANSIESVEEFATLELGMVYPKTSQTVYITDAQLEDTNVADLIKEKAYNK